MDFFQDLGNSNFGSIFDEQNTLESLWTASEQFQELCNLFSSEEQNPNITNKVTTNQPKEKEPVVVQPIKKTPIRPTSTSPKKDVFSVRSTRNIPINQRPLQSVSDKEDEEFENLCEEGNFYLNPHKLGFIPASFWPDQEVSFGDLVHDFFRRKNNPNSRFHHKLYNALKISEAYPEYKQFVGVQWLTQKIFLVNKFQFARLLAIGTIDGSLFHKQGNFTSHGFIQVSQQELIQTLGYERAEMLKDPANKILVHKDGSFHINSRESELNRCRWFGNRK